jgi:FAD dependent oxidoreductase TIGR03364
MNSSLPADATRADVIVVGAGTLGTFHAYFAARKGYKTLLLERNAFPNDASTRNFGMVLRTIVETDTQWTGFARASAAIYRALQQERDISVQVAGSLYLASTEVEARVLQEFADRFSSTFGCTYLTADEACARYAFIQRSYCRGALLFMHDLTVEPRRLMHEVIAHIVEQKLVDYRPFTNVVAIEPSVQHGIVKDARGNVYVADQIFVCSGAEYRTLFPAAFTSSGLRVCKLHMMRTVSQPQVLPHALLSGLSIQRYPAFKSCPSYHALTEQPAEEAIRDYGIHLLFKQATDGSIVIGDSHEYRSFEEASSLEESTNSAINQAILEYGQRMITLPSWDIQAMWNGYYLTHPQRDIYTHDVSNSVHIVTGIGGKGMSTGPGFAQANIAATLS